MNVFRELLFTFISIFLLTYSVKAADGPNLKESDYLKKIDLIYLELKDSLGSTEKTGDLNTDFLNQVLQYQRALIALSKNELQYGERKELKQPVDQFIDGLKLNLKKISKVQKKVSENPVYDETKEATYLSSYEEIYQQILTNLKVEGEQPTVLIGNSIDMDFLTRLSKQCEVWTIFMNSILQQTEDDGVKELANDLIQSSDRLKGEIQALIKQIEQ